MIDIVIDCKKRNQFFENFRHEANIRLSIKKLFLLSSILIIFFSLGLLFSVRKIPIITFITGLFGNPHVSWNMARFSVFFCCGVLFSLIVVYFYDRKANQLIGDYRESIGIDTLGVGVANVLIMPLIYFIRNLEIQDVYFKKNGELYRKNIHNLMSEEFGFSDKFISSFMKSNFSVKLDVLANRINDTNFFVESSICNSKGKVVKTYKKDLSFLLKRFRIYCKKIIMPMKGKAVLYSVKQMDVMKKCGRNVYKGILNKAIEL